MYSVLGIVLSCMGMVNIVVWATVGMMGCIWVFLGHCEVSFYFQSLVMILAIATNPPLSHFFCLFEGSRAECFHPLVGTSLFSFH